MMPQVKVIFFQEEDRRDPRITGKFHKRLVQLKEQGWQMMRPASDTLRDGIHEIRVRFGSVNYRLLYGFHEVEGQQAIAVLVHGLTKERAVPSEEIDLAVQRHAAFAADPQKHTYVRPPQPRR